MNRNESKLLGKLSCLCQAVRSTTQRAIPGALNPRTGSFCPDACGRRSEKENFVLEAYPTAQNRPFFFLVLSDGVKGLLLFQI